MCWQDVALIVAAAIVIMIWIGCWAIMWYLFPQLMF